MLTKKLFALALVSALGLGVTAAQADTFQHRESGFHQVRHGDFHKARHHRHHRHHNAHRGFR
jgi:Ni/Co efflux regulator RcnB